MQTPKSRKTKEGQVNSRKTCQSSESPRINQFLPCCVDDVPWKYVDAEVDEGHGKCKKGGIGGVVKLRIIKELCQLHQRI